MAVGREKITCLGVVFRQTAAAAAVTARHHRDANTAIPLLLLC